MALRFIGIVPQVRLASIAANRNFNVSSSKLAIRLLTTSEKSGNMKEIESRTLWSWIPDLFENRKKNITLSEYVKLMKQNTKLEIQLESFEHLRWLNFVQIHIDRWETDYGLINVKFDYTLAKKFGDSIDKSKEIRRQRWCFILTTHKGNPTVDNLLEEIQEAYKIESTAKVKEECNSTAIEPRAKAEKELAAAIEFFAQDVAEAYSLLSFSINSVILTQGQGSYGTTEVLRANKGLELLIKPLDFNVGRKVADLKKQN